MKVGAGWGQTGKTMYGMMINSRRHGRAIQYNDSIDSQRFTENRKPSTDYDYTPGKSSLTQV